MKPWPLVVRAQQSAMPVVGFMSSRFADAGSVVAAAPLRVVAFRQALGKLGWSEGRRETWRR